MLLAWTGNSEWKQCEQRHTRVLEPQSGLRDGVTIRASLRPALRLCSGSFCLAIVRPGKAHQVFDQDGIKNKAAPKKDAAWEWLAYQTEGTRGLLLCARRRWINVAGEWQTKRKEEVDDRLLVGRRKFFESIDDWSCLAASTRCRITVHQDGVPQCKRTTVVQPWPGVRDAPDWPRQELLR